MNSEPTKPKRAKEPPPDAKIAQIITSEQVVINVGRDDGVLVGDLYRIVIGVDVPDPDNPGTNLMTLEYTKGTIEVTQVFDRVSIAKPPSIPGLLVGGFSGGLSGGLGSGFGGFDFSRPTLNVADGAVALTNEQLKVRVGDKVRLDAHPK